MKCSNCQAENSKKSLYCSHCGLQITTPSRNIVRNDIAFFSVLAFIFITLSVFRGSVIYDYYSTIRQDRFYSHNNFLEKFPKSRYADHIRSDILNFFPTTYTPQNSFSGVHSYAQTYLADTRPIEAMTESELRFVNLSFKNNKYRSIADLPSIQDQLVSSMSEIFEIEELLPIDYFKLMTGYIQCSPSTVLNNPDLLDKSRSSIYSRISEIEAVPMSRLEEIETNHNYLKDLKVSSQELSDLLYNIVRNSIQNHNRNLFELIQANWIKDRNLEQFDTLVTKFQARFQNPDIAVIDSIGRIVRTHMDSIEIVVDNQDYLVEQYELLEDEVRELNREVVYFSFIVKGEVESEIRGVPMYEAVTEYGKLIIIETWKTRFTSPGRAELRVKRNPRKSLLYTNSINYAPLDVYTEYIGNDDAIYEQRNSAAMDMRKGKKELNNYMRSYRSWEATISSEIDKIFN